MSAPDPNRQSEQISLAAASPVRFYKTDDGWFCEANSKRLGPFSYGQLEAVDANFDRRLATELGVTVVQVFQAKPQPVVMEVESADPARRFKASASQGPDIPISGFIIFNEGDWISAEATFLQGELTEIHLEDTKHEEVTTTECVQPVLFYNHAGERGVKLSDGAVFRLGSRFLRPKSKTLGSSGLQTGMSFEAGQRFLHGEEISPDDLYPSALEGLRLFVNLDWDKRLYDVVACYTIASYFYDQFNAFPILILRGAFRGGKTRLLLAITYTGHRGLPILDPSEASIFRTGEAWKPLLGIDEFYDVSREIERILRAVYKKGPRVARIDKTKAGVLHLGLFDFYSKIVIATPEAVPSNIADKGITIQMRRMPDPHPAKRDPKSEDFEDFRSKAYIARLTWPPRIKEAASKLDEEELGLAGRDYEVWKPALTIAKLFGGKVWKNVFEY